MTTHCNGLLFFVVPYSYFFYYHRLTLQQGGQDMGSTLEAAVVFSAVITIISAFVICPLELCGRAKEMCDSFLTEQGDYLSNEEIVDTSPMGGYDLTDISPERFCTFLSGISDNYRIIYGTLGDSLDG